MTPSAPNLIVQENARPGTADWCLQRPAVGREIEGFASACSINRGESIDFHVHTCASSFALEIFRMGWYQGHGARRVHGPLSIQGQRQIMPIPDPATGLCHCEWTVSHTVPPSTTEHWLSGVYLARLTDAGTYKQSYIIFVVREDERTAPLLVQQSVSTYQAYNTWGGKSLYKWSSTDNKRANTLSFNRPYAANLQNPTAAYGMGAGEFLVNSQPAPAVYGVSNAGWEYNMLRWLEREGMDATYCTNIDVHANPSLFEKRKAWLSVGHDEYWSREMRLHVEAARDSGLHLAFFSANSAYWQIRMEPCPTSSTPNRLMVCHKSTHRDKLARKDCPDRATDKWRNLPGSASEDRLLGVMYACDPVDGDMRIIAPDHWLLDATGLALGDSLPGLLGYEVDSVATHSPVNMDIIAASPYVCLQDPTARGFSHMTLYTADSGALVFATGTIQWSWGLDDFNTPLLRCSRINPAVQQITRNLLQRFLSRVSSSSRDQGIAGEAKLGAKPE